jgi:NADH-quinone oxidoreductase subunit L
LPYFEATAWLVWGVPLLGAILVPVFGRIWRRALDYLSVLPSLISALLSTSLLPSLFTGLSSDNQVGWFGNIKAGVLVDPLSVIVGFAVSWVSFLIMLYSVDYMRGDSGLTRYWFFMNFFIGSMQLIVFSDNLLQLFFGWEGVGLCSYALIGHYYQDEKDKWVGRQGDVVLGVPQASSPTNAAIKAFIMTRVGDVFLLASIFMIYFYSGTFNYRQLISDTSWASSLHSAGLLLPAMLFMLGGAYGKSAQFPFHEWLPDAMTGPTPVSALIHAATMVKAGVFLVARMAPIFFLLPFAEVRTFFGVLAFLGAATALLAASQAVVNKELKKVLAYSTVSQIGYMMLALGVAGLTPGFVEAYSASLFQLLAHMLFKAGLFMGAGVVIHMASSYSLDDMGGLRFVARRSYIAFSILALALAGLPPLSGFFSKDAIFSSVLTAPPSLFLFSVYALSSITAVVTAFYSLRMLGLTFFGKRKEYSARDAGLRQLLSYAVLAAATILVGLGSPLFENLLNSAMKATLTGFGLSVLYIPFTVRPLALLTSLVVVVSGLLLAYPFYVSRRLSLEIFVRPWIKSIHTFLWNRLYINALYYRAFVYPVLSFSSFLFQNLEQNFFQRLNFSFSSASIDFASAGDWFDRRVVDGFMNAVGSAFAVFSRLVRRLQTGNAESYLFGIVAGLLFVLLLLYYFVKVV